MMGELTEKAAVTGRDESKASMTAAEPAPTPVAGSQPAPVAANEQELTPMQWAELRLRAWNAVARYQRNMSDNLRDAAALTIFLATGNIVKVEPK